MEQSSPKAPYIRKQLLVPLLGLFILLTLVHVLIGYSLLRSVEYQNVERDLQAFVRRVDQGLEYRNGSWDTTRYSADPQTPHPSGSSGFSNPLYIISADGFVIERNSPISGLLDSSDFTHLMRFREPENIRLITNEQWRLFSQPVLSNGSAIGVVVVALYHPEKYIPAVAEQKLRTNMEYLTSQLKVENGSIDASPIDIRNIEYDISFEIVNNFNKVILNNGRMPTFIDKSYIFDQMKFAEKTSTIQDASSRKEYVVVSHTLYNDEKEPVGVIVAGRPADYISHLFSAAWLPLVLLYAAAAGAAGYITYRIVSRATRDAVSAYEHAKEQKAFPSLLSFNKQSGALTIDAHVISFPKDSIQFFVCRAIFSYPKKPWEVEELLETIGETNTSHWRKVYDAASLINKKSSQFLPVKLVELKDKTYQLNPQLLSSLKTSN